MHGFACGNGFIHRTTQHRVGEEGAFFDFNIQTRQILIDNAPGARVDVTDFRVTHLTVRQTHFEPDASIRVGTFRPQRIHDRGFSVENGVILLIFTVAIAIQNHQYHRF